MKVTLSSSKTITITPAVTRTTAEINLLSTIDNPVQKKVIAITKEIGQVILWDNTTTPSYDAIGQWTDTDVANRLKEMFDK